MLKKIENAVVKPATIDRENGDGGRCTVYCQLHITPLERDLAKDISPEMADGIFKLNGSNIYVPRLEMIGSRWTPKLPVLNMKFYAHPELKQKQGDLPALQVEDLTVAPAKGGKQFTLVMGVFFVVPDWKVGGEWFDLIKRAATLEFEPTGQKALPLTIDREVTEGIGEFANARARQKGRKPVAPSGIQRVGGKR